MGFYLHVSLINTIMVYKFLSSNISIFINVMRTQVADFYYEMCSNRTRSSPGELEWNYIPCLLWLLIFVRQCHGLLYTYIIYYDGLNRIRQFRIEIIIFLIVCDILSSSGPVGGSCTCPHGHNSYIRTDTGSLWRLHRFNLNRFRRNRRRKDYCFSRWSSWSRNMILATIAQRGFGH